MLWYVLFGLCCHLLLDSLLMVPASTTSWLWKSNSRIEGSVGPARSDLKKNQCSEWHSLIKQKHIACKTTTLPKFYHHRAAWQSAEWRQLPSVEEALLTDVLFTRRRWLLALCMAVIKVIAVKWWPRPRYNDETVIGELLAVNFREWLTTDLLVNFIWVGQLDAPSDLQSSTNWSEHWME